MGVTILSWRHQCLWILGYPEAALADVEDVLERRARDRASRHIDLCSNLGAFDPNTLRKLCGGKSAVRRTFHISGGKGRPLLEGVGDAAASLLLGPVGQIRRRGPNVHPFDRPLSVAEATLVVPHHLSYLARAHAELGQFDEAWGCIDEAISLIEATNETWCEAEINRVAGEIALRSPVPDAGESGVLFRTRSRDRPFAASEVLGAARGDEPRPAVARAGQARLKPTSFSLRSTAGSPKASIRST